MALIEALYPSSAVKGVRWHKPSGCYIAEVGYHMLSIVGADGTVTTKRIRSTFYLGHADGLSEAESRFDSIKRDWVGWVSEQRKAYDDENQQRRSLGLLPLPRFKPVWPKQKVRRQHVKTLGKVLQQFLRWCDLPLI